jgi:hypothetical protein
MGMGNTKIKMRQRAIKEKEMKIFMKGMRTHTMLFRQTLNKNNKMHLDNNMKISNRFLTETHNLSG